MTLLNELMALRVYMVGDFKSWGGIGGVGVHILLKSADHNAVKALKGAVGKLVRGSVIPENPPNRLEQIRKVIRGSCNVMSDPLETEKGIKLEGQDSITQWLVR